MRKDTQTKFDWSGRMEQLEDRLVMSADPIGGLLGGQIQHHAIVDDLPTVEHHALLEEPPALEHHLQSEADFWIDSSDQSLLEEEFERIEQSLANAHDQSGLSQVRQDYGFEGYGQTVAVIDSGIAYDHFALGNGFGSNYRVVGGWDFTGENDADPYDDGPSGSHGTHVSGIVGARGGTHDGVAPGVDLVGLRVFDDAGNGYFSWVEDALQWVHANRNSFDNPITAVNLSLGVATWNSDSIPSWANLEDEFAQLEADGIFISVSAGNSFTDFDAPGLSYPAASPYVIPVASVDDSGLLSYFSQRNSRVIAAPGRGIISTVPDYTGNNNGITDDYASFSGTSMAAPYVAGASVIIREAMEFAGYTNITQDTIYDHMIATADSFYDSDTNAYYNRLNLESAIDALMPTDDFGSTVATAHNLGTISTGASTSGAITTLDDVDYFRFTAGSTGTISITASNMTHDLAANWQLDGGSGTWSGANNETFTIDVVGGQTYTVGFSSQDGLGYYDLGITTESTFDSTDWGNISFSQFAGLSISGEGWYRLVANSAGYMTAEAAFDAAGGNINLEFYDANFGLLASGNGSSGAARVDHYASTGEELYLKVIGTNSDVDFQLTNLVSVSGDAVTISGTSGDNSFSYESLWLVDEVTVNGTSYTFTTSDVASYTFNGEGGTDAITATGSSGDETAVLGVGSLNFAVTNLTVSASSVESITVNGGGGQDIAYLYDSVNDDVLVATPTSVQLSGSGFDNTANGFSRVNAFATAGGFDLAQFSDSAGDDRYISSAQYNEAYIYGTGYLNYSQGFERTEAYSTEGGTDRAYFYDSEGNDQFVASLQYQEAYMYGDGYLNYAKGFARNQAYATAGGTADTADFYDSAGDDLYVALPEYDEAYIYGNAILSYANGFDRTNAYATEGGYDLALFYDSIGDDRYVSSLQHDQAYMYADNYLHYSQGFDRTEAYANAGGHDRAYFYDSAENDRYVTSGLTHEAYMYNSGYLNYAHGFERNYGFAIEGGSKDRAYFYDSEGNDLFGANAEQADAYMSGSDFLNYASGFDRNYAYSIAGGNDVADLNDSTGDDQFYAGSAYQTLYGNNVLNYLQGFEQINVYASQGNDEAEVETLATGETIYGLNDLARITRAAEQQDLYGFDEVTATLAAGGSSDVDEGAIDYIYNELGA